VILHTAVLFQLVSERDKVFCWTQRYKLSVTNNLSNCIPSHSLSSERWHLPDEHLRGSILGGTLQGTHSRQDTGHIFLTDKPIVESSHFRGAKYSAHRACWSLHVPSVKRFIIQSLLKANPQWLPVFHVVAPSFTTNDLRLYDEQ